MPPEPIPLPPPIGTTLTYDGMGYVFRANHLPINTTFQVHGPKARKRRIYDSQNSQALPGEIITYGMEAGETFSILSYPPGTQTQPDQAPSIPIRTWIQIRSLPGGTIRGLPEGTPFHLSCTDSPPTSPLPDPKHGHLLYLLGPFSKHPGDKHGPISLPNHHTSGSGSTLPAWWIYIPNEIPPPVPSVDSTPPFPRFFAFKDNQWFRVDDPTSLGWWIFSNNPERSNCYALLDALREGWPEHSLAEAQAKFPNTWNHGLPSLVNTPPPIPPPDSYPQYWKRNDASGVALRIDSPGSLFWIDPACSGSRSMLVFSTVKSDYTQITEARAKELYPLGWNALPDSSTSTVPPTEQATQCEPSLTPRPELTVQKSLYRYSITRLLTTPAVAAIPPITDDKGQIVTLGQPALPSKTEHVTLIPVTEIEATSQAEVKKLAFQRLATEQPTALTNLDGLEFNIAPATIFTSTTLLSC